jgi:hypothetical protein
LQHNWWNDAPIWWEKAPFWWNNAPIWWDNAPSWLKIAPIWCNFYHFDRKSKQIVTLANYGLSIFFRPSGENYRNAGKTEKQCLNEQCLPFPRDYFSTTFAKTGR